jgi:hypothetical protein
MPKKTTNLASVGLGFRVHSGWAAVVAVKGPASSPAVVDRRRIELADPAIRGSLQPFHAAAELDPAAAEELIKQRADSTNALALQSLRQLIGDLRLSGNRFVHPVGLRSTPGDSGIDTGVTRHDSYGRGANSFVRQSDARTKHVGCPWPVLKSAKY